MEVVKNNKGKFSVAKRAKSFAHAWRGVFLFLKDTHNAWIHVVIFAAALILGIHFGISSTQWVALVLASGLVFTAEALNTAIEVHVNLISPENHPYARDTKDIAAGAVLMSAATAFAIGVIIFLPKVLEVFYK